MKDIKLLYSTIILAGVLGCATQVEKQIEKDISQQPSVSTPQQAAEDGRTSILHSANLTEDQKMKIVGIIDITKEKTKDIKEQQAKIISALMQSLSKGSYVDKEMSVYKSKLQKLENEKMKLMFSSLKEVKMIIGPNNEIDPTFYRSNLVHLL